jgi:hypothetical protein
VTVLPYTDENISLIQEFIDRTKIRIQNGVEITFTRKASRELEELVLEFNIEVANIKNEISALKVENYYRGIEPSGSADFDVCAFCVKVGENDIEIYLKFGLEVNGEQILLFSNHVPKYSMNQPFNK